MIVYLLLEMSNDWHNRKWQKFLKRVWLFSFIPFVDFVFAAGSLVTGKMHEDSDFDVIVGVRQGRIFTARAFCILVFGLLGWRRPGNLQTYKLTNLQTSNRFCFNHFITPKSYRLSPPHNEYWQNLYFSLAPIYGEKVLIQKFWDANRDWMAERKVYSEDKRHLYREQGFWKQVLEELFSGKLGDWLEQKLKTTQIKRIEQSLKSTQSYKPRIIYTDDELEFHPDTRRIEEALH